MSRRTYRLILAASALVSVIAIATILYVHVSRKNTSALPPQIAPAVSFAALVPVDHKLLTNPAFEAGVLSYRYAGPVGVLITEQPEPDVFTDVPEYYPTLLTKLNKYAVVQTDKGQLQLTKPTELKGEQSAVLRYQGTLLFARPEGQMADGDWQRLFSSLRPLQR